MPILNSVLMGSDTSDATALAEDIVLDKTAYVDGDKITGTLIPAKPNITSTTIINLPSNQNFNSACYGNGKFVIVPTKGDKAAYSTDGVTWTETTLPNSAYWQSACYGDGKFVAVASNSRKAAYSTDGINWTATTLPYNDRWTSVCYGNGKFVAICYVSNYAAYSTDGINWIRATSHSSSNHWNTVCYGNGKFVTLAFGEDKAAYSTDGINWTTTTLPGTANWGSVCYGNGKFVAVARESNAAIYSIDGITWTTTFLPSNNNWRSICYGNGMFIAAVDSPYTNEVVAYSIDGVVWAAATDIPINRGNWVSMCYGNGKFIITSYNNNGIAVLTTRIPPDYTDWGTANPENVLEGTTFTSNEGFTLDGAMIKHSELSQELDPGNSYTIPKGYHDGSSVITASSLGSETPGTAIASDILSGETAWVNGSKITGTMPDNGAKTASLSADQSYTIPQGYHNGSGKVTAKSLASQTAGTAIASEILKDSTAWVNGTKVTGTMTDQGAKTASLNAGGSYTIPAGYHNGSGKVAANSLASQTAGTAEATEILNGETAWVNGVKVTGTMTNQGAKTSTLNAGESYTIPAGYHNGSGEVTANSLASQTAGTATAPQILTKSTAWVNGVKVTGTMPDNSGLSLPPLSAGSSTTIPTGYYKGFSVEADSLANQTSATAEATEILSGETAWVNGTKVTGTMANQGAKTSTLNAGGSYTIPAGYHNGSGKVTANSLASQTSATAAAEDIVEGKTAWVNGSKQTGTLVPVKPDISSIATATLPSSLGGEYASICYGDGKFVAVGGNQKIMYSVNGHKWTLATESIEVAWTSVCYGNGKFVAAGMASQNAIAYSSDGINWTQLSTSVGDVEYMDGNFSSICYVHGEFLAIDVGGSYTWSSVDGINWTRYKYGDNPGSSVRDILCYGNDRFILINGEYSTNGTYCYTTNLKQWVRNELSLSTASVILRSTCYGNGKFVIITNSNEAVYSTDGVNWTTTTLPSSANWRSVCYGNGMFIAAASDSNQGAYSTDGINWTTITLPSSANWYSICYGDEKFVAITNDGTEVAVLTTHKPPNYMGNASPEDVLAGVTFTSNEEFALTGTLIPAKPDILDTIAATLPSDLQNLPIVSVCYGNGTFVTAGGGIMYDTAVGTPRWRSATLSGDGISGPYASVCYGKGKFVAGSLGNSLIYSEDGINWKSAPSILDGTTDRPTFEGWDFIPASVCYGDGKFVSAHFSGSAIGISLDGINWTTQDISINTSQSTICYGNGKFIISSITSPFRSYYSTDLDVWIKITISAKLICYGGGIFVAINSNSNLIMYSPDCINWTEATLPSTANWESVCYGNGLFVAIASGSNIAAYSVDGIMWNTITLPSSANWKSICYGEGRFVIVAQNSNQSVVLTTRTPPDYSNWGSVHPENVLEGVTFTSNEGFALDGTMTDQGAVSQTLDAGNSYTIPAGYHNGSGKVTANSLASQTSATAAAEDIVKGKTAWVNGSKQTGTLVPAKPDIIDVTQGTLLESANWQHICYGNGKFIATQESSGASMSYSEDGINWIAGTFNPPSSGSGPVIAPTLPSILGNICYGKGYFVISLASYGKGSATRNILLSDDGINWNSIAAFSLSAKNRKICYGNGKFVSIGQKEDDSTVVDYSTDARSWEYIELSISATWGAICYGNEKFVAIANNSSKAVYSADGINWTAVTLPTSSSWQSICYGNGKFIALANDNNGTIAYSIDGINWTLGTSLGLKCNSIYYGNGLFVITTSVGGVIAYSKDGIRWTKETLLTDANWISVCYSNEKFVTIANGSNAVSILTTRIPPNYTNWGTARPEDVPEGITFTSNKGFALEGKLRLEPVVDITEWIVGSLPSSAQWKSICYGDGKFVAVSNNNGNIYSIDGITWIAGALPQLMWKSICYGNGKFVVVSSGEMNTSYYSTDGITWIMTELPEDNEEDDFWQSVCYGNGKFVAVRSSKNCAYSTDGINWTATTLPSSTSWNSVCYGNGKFVAVASSNAAYSTNGITWTAVTLPSSGSWASVCYGNGMFVAAGYISIGTTPSDMSIKLTVTTSVDGITWTEAETLNLSGGSKTLVCFGDGKFIIMAGVVVGSDGYRYGSNRAAYSKDGINWVEFPLPNYNKWSDICYGNGRLIIMSESDDTCQYTDTLYRKIIS